MSNAETRNYTVSVSNVFEATSPEDAVMQMAAWLDDYSYSAGYRVVSENFNLFIDAGNISTEFDGNEEHEDNGPCCECGSPDHTCQDCPTFMTPPSEFDGEKA